MEHFIDIDGGILLWIQENLRTDLMTVIMKAVTRLGNKGLFFVTAAILMLMFKSTRKTGAALSLGLIINVLIVNVILKNVFNRIRPYEVVDGLKCLIPEPKDASFPSGHASHAFAAVAVIWVMMPRIYGIIALIISILMAYSRLYLGVHFPSDVIAGILFGILAGAISLSVVRAIEKRWKGNAGRLSESTVDN